VPEKLIEQYDLDGSAEGVLVFDPASLEQ